MLDVQAPLGALGHRRVVGHDDEREAAVAPEPFQQVHDLVAGLLVEVAGRLVGEQHVGLLHERPRDRDALLLAARELARHVTGAIAEADGRERVERPPPSLVRAGTPSGASAVSTFSCARERRDQVEALEHEADLLRTDAAELAIGQVRQLRRRRG